MSWSAITAQAVTDQFTELEAAAIAAVQSSAGTSRISNLIALTVAEWRDTIRAGAYALNSDATTIPTGFHNAAIAMIRWRLLCSLPADDNLQSKAREGEYNDAREKLRLIANSKWSVESPEAEATAAGGCWNSENKIRGRMNPVPRPASQFPASRSDYANPDAPADKGTTP